MQLLNFNLKLNLLYLFPTQEKEGAEGHPLFVSKRSLYLKSRFGRNVQIDGKINKRTPTKRSEIRNG